MNSWDPAAQQRLRDVADDLRDLGLIDLLQEVVRDVWRYNVDRYDPEEIGDTNRSLGVTATENVRSLVLRRMGPDGDERLDRQLRASGADNSLLIYAPGGTRLRVMKGPPSEQLTEPRWMQTEWSSEVRLDAASANHANYIPVGVNDLFDGAVAPSGAASLLREVFLVWAGGARSPLTAGWLGFPTRDSVPWLAIERLWWDKPEESLGYGSSAGPLSDGDTFDTRPMAEPQVELKRTHTRRESATDE